MQDPFESSLKSLFNDEPEASLDDARLNRVLKTANRQIGVGALFRLLGYWFDTLMLACNSVGTARTASVTKRLKSSPSEKSRAE